MLELLLFVLVAVLVIALIYYALSLVPLPENLKHLVLLIVVVMLVIALIYRVGWVGGPVVLWP